jgi:hypothetical protein
MLEHGDSGSRKWPVVPVSKMDGGDEGVAKMADGGRDLGRQESLVLTEICLTKLL